MKFIITALVGAGITVGVLWGYQAVTGKPL